MSKPGEPLFPLKRNSEYTVFLIIMAVVLVISMILATRLGSVDLKFAAIGKVLISKLPWTSSDSGVDANITSIIWDIRIPRILTAFVVGAGLTVCGILMQALTKNPLADPYVLGISQGASAGAVSVIMYGWLSIFGLYGRMIGAFLGAVVSIVLAMKIASIRNKITATQLVLAGIAVSALFGAITNFMIYHTKTGSDKVKVATYWMMGSLNGSNWQLLFYASVTFAICLVVIILMSRKLDVLLLGEEVAVTVGVDTDKLKLVIILLSTLLTGVIVSISGTIGFVGLTIPHITRSIVGTRHVKLIPAAILVGGTFLVLADMISRVIVRPEELPIGVVSAFFGAPFFLYLIRKSHGKFGG